MHDAWKFLGTIDWAGVVIPVIAILVPTLIAIRLATRERGAAHDARIDARAEAVKERRLRASEGVILGLAHLVSVNPMTSPLQERFGELRGRIAVYRAWIEAGDLSGDWLALKHKQGFQLLRIAMEEIQSIGGSRANPEEVDRLLEPPRQWAQSTIDTFSEWLSGDVDIEVLRAEGAELIGERET